MFLIFHVARNLCPVNVSGFLRFLAFAMKLRFDQRLTKTGITVLLVIIALILIIFSINWVLGLHNALCHIFEEI